MNFFDCFLITALGIYYVLFIAKTLYMKRSGINPFVGLPAKHKRRAVIYILFFSVFLFWNIEVIFHTLKFNFHIFPGNVYKIVFDVFILKILGVSCVSAGLVIFTFSLITFRDSWRVGIDEKSPGKLVTNGIFSFSRNPIYVFLDLFLFGTWLIYPNFLFLIAFILTSSVFHYQILKEEEFLFSRYGREYQDYTRNVRRYFTLSYKKRSNKNE